jgi:hypothetical protein
VQEFTISPLVEQVERQRLAGLRMVAELSQALSRVVVYPTTTVSQVVVVVLGVQVVA